MRIKIPYVSTSVETDLTMTFFLTPLWWVLGFNIFIYQLVVYVSFVRLLVSSFKTNQVLRLPGPILWYGVFLLSYLASMLLNASSQPLQRILSSMNHFLVFIMGLLLVMMVCCLDHEKIQRNFFRACWILSGVTGILGVIFLGLWFLGHNNIEFPSLVGYVFPSISEYPFFYLFSIVRIISSDWIFTELPRLSIYSAVQTATGGFIMMVLPLGMAHVKLNGIRGFAYYPVLLCTLTVLLFSLSRSAICAFLAALSFVWFLEKRNRLILSLVVLVLTFFGARWLYQGLIWILNLRPGSTVGRISVYSDALKIVMEENPLMGIGVRPRNEFTMMAIGSHSTYVGLLVVAGFLGLCLFGLFQLTTFATWLRQKGFLAGRDQEIIWRYLGISYVGALLWFLTDTLDTLPFVAYTYFLVAGCILGFQRASKALEK